MCCGHVGIRWVWILTTKPKIVQISEMSLKPFYTFNCSQHESNSILFDCIFDYCLPCIKGSRTIRTISVHERCCCYSIAFYLQFRSHFCHKSISFLLIHTFLLFCWFELECWGCTAAPDQHSTAHGTCVCVCVSKCHMALVSGIQSGFLFYIGFARKILLWHGAC